MRKVIDTREATDAKELMEALEQLTHGLIRDTVYLESGDNSRVILALIESTLSDGSKTHEIQVSN